MYGMGGLVGLGAYGNDAPSVPAEPAPNGEPGALDKVWNKFDSQSGMAKTGIVGGVFVVGVVLGVVIGKSL